MTFMEAPVRRIGRIQKWLLLIGTSSWLLQAATGCPNKDQLIGVASTSTQSLVNGIFGLYVKAAINSVFGV